MLLLISLCVLCTPPKKNCVHNFKDKFLIIFCGLLHIQVQRQKKHFSFTDIIFSFFFVHAYTHVHLHTLPYSPIAYTVHHNTYT